MLKTKLAECDAEEAEKKSRLEELRVQMESLQSKLEDLDREAIQIENSTASKGDKTSEAIQNLLATYERLKSDEKLFKEMCNEELERLQGLAAQAGLGLRYGNLSLSVQFQYKHGVICCFLQDDTNTPQSEIEAQLQRARSRLEAGKTELGAVNRKLALLKRQIDSVPGVNCFNSCNTFIR